MGMMLNYGNGHSVEVKPGLVDKHGTFLLLVDENETRHYRFSGEADLITRLQDEIRGLEKRVERQQDAIDRLAERNGRLSARLAELDEKLREMGDGE